MQLELKVESNSPFWLIGAGKNGTFSGSNTNIPCFAKSIKKQKELASQIFKNNNDVLEVYLLTGVQWDNMPSGRKEELGYIKNKGKMILSKDQLNEGDYPKGVSRDPLPKKGVKTYTSVATALEGKGDEKMKLELNDEKIIKEELTDIEDISEDLQDRFFTTMGDGRPEMFKKFTKEELKLFADFVKQLPKEEITDLERSMTLVAISLAHGDDLTVEPEIDDNIANESLKLKESKIVTPVGNPQTASSFVNIDVDLDHMEVSDFIVRLAQAIRSEQTSVLEYVALRSANGITNEERTNIDAIIEEEKNHMVAFTTMLYKQLLTNHKQNVDGANEEFTLPTFGPEIFDNSKEGKLTESINLIVEKLAIKEASVRMSDEYFIGNNEDGRMYHGLGAAMNIIKDMISTSGEQVVVQNVTLADSKKENIKLEDTFNSIDELINELKTDTNYDEIAYHIHEYAKINKARALELMDKLFGLERDKSPQECRDILIDELETENKQYKMEDIKTSFAGETMTQTQWDVEVDVNYDADFQLKVIENVRKAIHAMNPETYESENYAIAEDKGKCVLAGDKLRFEIITYNTFDREVNEEFIAEVCDKLFNKASTYEYFIERA